MYIENIRKLPPTPAGSYVFQTVYDAIFGRIVSMHMQSNWDFMVNNDVVTPLSHLTPEGSHVYRKYQKIPPTPAGSYVIN